MTDKVAIIGASGFAREVRDICWDLGARNICFLGMPSDPNEIDGFPVFNDEPQLVERMVASGWRLTIGVSHPAARARIAKAHASYPFVTLIHPTATFGWGQRAITEQATGAVLAAGVRLMSNVRFGEHVVLSLNVTVGHDAELGSYCAVMPGAGISGNVILEECVYMGVGSVTLNGQPDRPLVIGVGATIGAGAVVVRDVKAGETVVGVPGRPLQKS